MHSAVEAAVTNRSRPARNTRSIVAICNDLIRLSLVLLLVPDLGFVAGPGTQVPRFDEDALRLVNVIVVSDLFHAHFHAVLCEDNVLLLHLLRGGIGDLHDREVDVVPDKCQASQDSKEDNEREELAGGQLEDDQSIGYGGTHAMADLGGAGGLGTFALPQAMMESLFFWGLSYKER